MVSANGLLGLDSSLQLLQPPVPTTTCEKRKSLKFILAKVSSASEIISADATSKIPGNSCLDGVPGVSHSSYGLKVRISLNSRNSLITISHKRKSVAQVQKNTGVYPADAEVEVSERYSVMDSVTNACKRLSVTSLDNPKRKKRKIESRVMPQCATLLKKLMCHRHGWIFNKPVDPVALQIPDYFDVISKPMDFGTIKSNLEKKLYLNPEEFAADMRLTFANALLYNPPLHEVHIITKELQSIFERGWKSLEVKWSATSLGCEQQSNSVEIPTQTLDMRQDVPRNEASCLKVSNKVTVQRQKLRRDLEEMSRSNIPSMLLDQIREMGLIGQYENRIDVNVDAVDDITVIKLQKLIRSIHEMRSLESSHTQYSCGRDSFQKDLHKGDSNNSSGCVSDKLLTGSLRRIGSCESVNHTGSTNVIDSDRSSDRSNQNLPADDPARRQKVKSRPDFVEAASNVDSSSHLPTTSSAAVSEEGLGWESNTYDEQLSPSKALRAALLKSRFAATIVKARQKTLLDTGEKTDPVKMKLEKEKLERQQLEEKARIEAQIKASQKREEMEKKQQRQREREAARIALEKVTERCVEIYENLEVLNEIEDYQRLSGGYPLHRLGIFLKDDDFSEVEGEEVVANKSTCNNLGVEICSKGEATEGGNCSGDVEEGEIAS